MNYKQNIQNLLHNIQTTGAGCGVDSRKIKKLCTDGKLVKLCRSKYISAEYFKSLDDAQKYRVKLLALASVRTDVVFGHVSAAVLLGIPVVSLPLHFHFVSHTRRSEKAKNVVHHLGTSGFRYIQVAGLKIQSKPQLFLSCCTSLSFAEALVIGDHLLKNGVKKADLEHEFKLQNITRGSRVIKKVLLHVTHLSDSVGESLCRAALISLGYLDFTVQHRILHFRVDFAFVKQRVVVEFDGVVKFDGRYGRPSDAIRAQNERERLIREQGWQVVRVNWDIVRNEAWLKTILFNYL